MLLITEEELPALKNAFKAAYYVVSQPFNLKESTDRKKHIIDEFTKMKITNYEFFEATHYEDPKVKELYDSGNVLTFPPCFRCLKKRCSCENNF